MFLKRFSCNLFCWRSKKQGIEESRKDFGQSTALMENWSHFREVNKPVLQSWCWVTSLLWLCLLHSQFWSIDKLTLVDDFPFVSFLQLEFSRSVWLTGIFIACDRLTSIVGRDFALARIINESEIVSEAHLSVICNRKIETNAHTLRHVSKRHSFRSKIIGFWRLRLVLLETGFDVIDKRRKL